MKQISPNYIIQPKICFLLLFCFLSTKGYLQEPLANSTLSQKPLMEAREIFREANSSWNNRNIANKKIIIDIKELKSTGNTKNINSLILSNCSINIIDKEGQQFSNKNLKKERSDPPKYFLFKINAKKIKISNCVFKNESNDLVGLLYATGAEDVLIENNEIEKFHGGIYCEAGNSEVESKTKLHYLNSIFFRRTICNIKKNLLNKNSFGNLVISGFDNVYLSENKVYFAGNGTSGDGFNIFHCKEIFVRNNKFLGGSCYGGHIELKETENVWIKDNIWINTITSCLRVTEIETFEKKSRNLYIIDNLFVDNGAYGIFLDGIKTPTLLNIKQNVFHKTIPAFGLPPCEAKRILRENVFSIEQRASKEYFEKNIIERLSYQAEEY